MCVRWVSRRHRAVQPSSRLVHCQAGLDLLDERALHELLLSEHARGLRASMTRSRAQPQ